MQLLPDLTLETAIQRVRQVEDVEEQMSRQLQQALLNVQEVAQRRPWKGGKRQPGAGTAAAEQARSLESRCRRCCKEKHNTQAKCPALDTEYRKCRKTGHWERLCVSKSVREVTQDSKEDDESFYLGAVSNTSQGSADQSSEQITRGQTPVTFRIGTGADVTVMNQETFNTLIPKRHLEESKGLLDSPGGALDIMGQCTASTLHKNRKYIFNIFVARGPTLNNLLGQDTAVEMGLVKRVQQVRTAVGLWDTLKTDPVRSHLKEEHGVIEKVTQPTDWCAPMVPVMKRTGAVTICVGLQKLNENLRRERYQMPTTDETLTKLAGSTVFTSLDAASGFWQMPLHEDSCLLTTFITPFGRYCFKRLPFGINIALEIFQRKMNELLEGLEGVAVR